MTEGVARGFATMRSASLTFPPSATEENEAGVCHEGWVQHARNTFMLFSPFDGVAVSVRQQYGVYTRP